MARYFSDSRIAELQVGQDEMHTQYEDLREKFCLRSGEACGAAQSQPLCFAHSP
jgi:hypothetical protein